jgi:hypothetical protein
VFPELLFGLRIVRVEIELPHHRCKPLSVRRRIDQTTDCSLIRGPAAYNREPLENVWHNQRCRRAQDHARDSQSGRQFPYSKPVEQRKQRTGENAGHQPQLHGSPERRAIGMSWKIRGIDQCRGLQIDKSIGDALCGTLRLCRIRRSHADSARSVPAVRPDQDAVPQPEGQILNGNAGAILFVQILPQDQARQACSAQNRRGFRIQLSLIRLDDSLGSILIGDKLRKCHARKHGDCGGGCSGFPQAT